MANMPRVMEAMGDQEPILEKLHPFKSLNKNLNNGEEEDID
jgi:hypothetical protein